jgi:glycosyltransferase involved in cell wall biosynthesis
MNKISGLVITFNESKNIVECLRSLALVCDDIVVVDSNSTDDTAELVRAAGAQVVLQAFLGDGPQRSAGLPHCRHDWVLNLDADERLEDDLVAYLQRTDLAALGVDAVETRRRNFVGQRTTRHGGQYPDYVLRIFNRRQADFSPVVAHTRIQAAKVGRCEAHIRHYSYRDYADIFSRACLYANWMGKELAASKKTVRPWHPALHGCSAFIKHYFVKTGFMAGLDGLTISLGKALASYLKYARALEIRRTAG